MVGSSLWSEPRVKNPRMEGKSGNLKEIARIARIAKIAEIEKQNQKLTADLRG